MNKDIKGLIKYFLLIIIMALLMVASYIAFFIGIMTLISPNDDPNADFLFEGCLFLGGLCAFPIFSIILICLTVKALNNNWSKYITSFFNLVPLHVSMLCIMLFLIPYIENFNFGTYFFLESLMEPVPHILIFIFPGYFLIFLTALLNKNIHFFKEKPSEKVGGLTYFLFIIFAFLISIYIAFGLDSFPDNEYKLPFVFVLYQTAFFIPIYATKKAMDENWNQKLNLFFDNISPNMFTTIMLLIFFIMFFIMFFILIVLIRFFAYEHFRESPFLIFFVAYIPFSILTTVLLKKLCDGFKEISSKVFNCIKEKAKSTFCLFVEKFRKH